MARTPPQRPGLTLTAVLTAVLTTALRSLVLLSPLAATGCLYGLALIPAFDGDDSSSTQTNQATIEAPAVARTSGTEATISFVVRGDADGTALLIVETDAAATAASSSAVAAAVVAPAPGAPFRPATLSGGTDGVTIVSLEGVTYARVGTSPAGVLHSVTWDLAADGIEGGALARVRVTQVAEGGAAMPGAADRAGITSQPLPVGNDPPTVAIIPAAGPQGRTVVTSFTVSDPFGDDVEVSLSVRDVTGGGAAMVVPSLLGAGGGATTLTASPTGARGDIAWSSTAAFGVRNVTPVALVLTARDRFGLVATASAEIEVRNDAPASAQILRVGTGGIL